MPQILPSSAPSPRAVLGYDGTAYRVLTVDAAGNVQVDVLASGLPAGAATAANQATILTRLGEIRDLEDSGRMYRVTHRMVGAGNYSMLGHVVDPGTVFVMTLMGAYNEDSTIAKLYEGVFTGALNCWFNYDVTLVAFEVLSWAGRAYLQAGYSPKCYFQTVANGNDLVMVYSGYTLAV